MGRARILLTLAAAFLMPVLASASLLDDEIFYDFSWEFEEGSPDGISGSAIVGLGPEINFDILDDATGSSASLVVDIQSEDIWIDFEIHDFTEFIMYVSFDDLDWIGTPGEIVGVDVVVDSNGEGIDATSAFFGPNFFGGDIFTIDLLAPGHYSVHYHLNVVHEEPVIPEPATMTLMGIGLAGFALRRKTKA